MDLLAAQLLCLESLEAHTSGFLDRSLRVFYFTSLNVETKAH